MAGDEDVPSQSLPVKAHACDGKSFLGKQRRSPLCAGDGNADRCPWSTECMRTATVPVTCRPHHGQVTQLLVLEPGREGRGGLQSSGTQATARRLSSLVAHETGTGRECRGSGRYEGHAPGPVRRAPLSRDLVSLHPRW